MLRGICIKLFLERLGEHDGEPHRTLLGQPTKFQIRHSSFPRKMRLRQLTVQIIGVSDEVTVHLGR